MPALREEFKDGYKIQRYKGHWMKWKCRTVMGNYDGSKKPCIKKSYDR